MEAATLPSASDTPAPVPVGIDKLLPAWIEVINDYLQRQYEEIIRREPSVEKLHQFRIECKWLLRSALKLDGLINDPEYPRRDLAAEIPGKLLQLKESWRMLNNPMTDAQAEAILTKAFPDESRAGSSA